MKYTAILLTALTFAVPCVAWCQDAPKGQAVGSTDWQMKNSMNALSNTMHQGGLKADGNDQKLTSWTTLLHLSDAAKVSGRYDEAEKLLNQLLAEAKADKSLFFEVVANNRLAGIYKKQGKFKEALALYEIVLAQTATNHGKTSTEYATILDNEAVLYDETKELQKAAELRKQAINIYQSNGPSFDLAMVYANHAANLDAQGKYAEAESTGKKAIRTYEAVTKPDDPSLAIAWDNLGNIQGHLGKLEDSEESRKRSLSILIKTYGIESPDAIITMSNLAQTCMQNKHYEDAQKFMAAAVISASKVYGKESDKTNELISVYAAMLQQIPKSARIPIR